MVLNARLRITIHNTFISETYRFYTTNQRFCGFILITLLLAMYVTYISFICGLAWDPSHIYSIGFLFPLQSIFLICRQHGPVTELRSREFWCWLASSSYCDLEQVRFALWTSVSPVIKWESWNGSVVLNPIRLMFSFFFNLVRESMSGGEGQREWWERERERIRILSRLHAQCGARHGTRSQDPGIMTWQWNSRSRHSTVWATQAPWCLILISDVFSVSLYYCKFIFIDTRWLNLSVHLVSININITS